MNILIAVGIAFFCLAILFLVVLLTIYKLFPNTKAWYQIFASIVVFCVLAVSIISAMDKWL